MASSILTRLTRKPAWVAAPVSLMLAMLLYYLYHHYSSASPAALDSSSAANATDAVAPETCPSDSPLLLPDSRQLLDTTAANARRVLELLKHRGEELGSGTDRTSGASDQCSPAALLKLTRQRHLLDIQSTLQVLDIHVSLESLQDFVAQQQEHCRSLQPSGIVEHFFLSTMDRLNDVVSTSFGFVCGALIAIIPQLYILLLAFVFPALTKREPWLIKKPAALKKTPREAKSIMTAIESHENKESCNWLNVILQKLWLELYDRKIQSAFRQAIQDELDDLKKESIAGFIECTKLFDCQAPAKAPVFRNAVILQSKKGSGAKMVVFDVDLNSKLHFVVEIVVKYFDAPVHVSVTINRMRFQLLLEFAKRPEDTLSFGFLHRPELDFDVSATVYGQHYEFVRKQISNAVFKTLQNKFTMPNLKARWLFGKPAPIKEGYLIMLQQPSSTAIRKLLPVGHWKKLWFILSEKSISYFSNHLEPRPIASIPLETITAVHLAISEARQKCIALEVVNEDFVILGSDNRESLTEWKEKIGSLRASLVSKLGLPFEDSEYTAVTVEGSRAPGKAIKAQPRLKSNLSGEAWKGKRDIASPTQASNSHELDALLLRLQEVNRMIADFDTRFGVKAPGAKDSDDNVVSMARFQKSLHEARRKILTEILTLDPSFSAKQHL